MRNIIKVYVLWKHQHVGCKHSFLLLRLRKKIVFVEMLYLRTSGDGASWRWVLYQERFYQFWLRSQKREKERPERAWGRVSGESSGWVYQRKTKPNEFFSPPLFAACVQCLLLFGGSMNLFLFIFS